jgi:Raf kinase inhibitor-like YbhB/YbcL family protein
MSLTLTSSAFKSGGPIPTKYTCDGPDLSPPLAWSGVPPAARSLVLIVDDPDAPDPAAPKMTWVHWVLYNLPPGSTGLPEGVSRDALPSGTLEGITDFRRTGWGGPCPPIGRHRYFFKLYALDQTLPATARQTKAQLERAMTGHVVGAAELMGTYQKGRR